MGFVFLSGMSVQISRMLAAKAALAIRYDALGEDTNAEMGAENRAKLEARLRQLEERGVSTDRCLSSCLFLVFRVGVCSEFSLPVV